MSLILEALRKMEQERRSRKGAATGIRAEVLRYRASVRQPKARPYLALGVAAVLVLAGVGVGVLVNRDGSHGTHGNYGGGRKSEAASAVAPVAPAAPVAPVAPAPTAPVAAGPAPMAVAPPEPAGQVGSARSSAAVRTETPPAALAPAFRAVAPKTGRRALAAGSQTAPATTAATAATRPQAQPLRREAAQDAPAVPTDITISGIAYQDERSLRRAVLNGALVGEGAEVAGARVVEIKENKVRMSRGGQVFEVPFSSGLNAR